MIILLCVDEADADRFRRLANAEQPVLAMVGARVPPGIQPGARVLRTNRWRHDEGAIEALRRLSVPLVDPTGLLGNVDRRVGARSTQPWGTVPVGGSLEAARNDPTRRRSYHEGVL